MIQGSHAQICGKRNLLVGRAGCLLGFVLLHIFTRRLRRFDGQTFLLYVVWYGLGRFFIEGLRQDSLIIPGTALRVSQVVALVSVLAAVVLLIVFRERTSLSGCGAKDVMALNAVVDDIPDQEKKEDEEDGKSTIFGDLQFEELITDTSASGKAADETAPAQAEKPAQDGEPEPAAQDDAQEDEKEKEEKEEQNNGKAD